MNGRHDPYRVLKRRTIKAAVIGVLAILVVIGLGIVSLVAFLATAPPYGGGR